MARRGGATGRTTASSSGSCRGNVVEGFVWIIIIFINIELLFGPASGGGMTSVLSSLSASSWQEFAPQSFNVTNILQAALQSARLFTQQVSQLTTSNSTATDNNNNEKAAVVEFQLPVRNLDPHQDHQYCTQVKETQDFKRASGVLGIITGCEHIGSDEMSYLIESIPGVFAAAECGMLGTTGSSPAAFAAEHPFFDWMMHPNFWKVPALQRMQLLSSPCFAAMYQRLYRSSPIYTHDLTVNSWIIDNTPRYIYTLKQIMDATPGLPVIVLVQTDDAAQIQEWVSRAGPGDYSARLNSAKTGLANALQAYPERIFVVETNRFLYSKNQTAVNEIMTAVYQFLGIPASYWKPEYTSMDAYNQKATAVALPTIKPLI